MSELTKTNRNSKGSSTVNVRGLTVTGMLSAIAIILMLFDFPLGFAPSFYKLDLSEVPVLIGAFTLGPLTGLTIEFIKILGNLLINGTDTACIGELSNFLIGASLILPSAIIYNKKKTKKGATIGLMVGTVTLVIVGSMFNAFLLLPIYANAFHMPIEALIEMGTVINPNINNLSTFILFVVAPFNLLKGVVVSIITLLLYKKISPIIKGNRNV